MGSSRNSGYQKLFRRILETDSGRLSAGEDPNSDFHEELFPVLCSNEKNRFGDFMYNSSADNSRNGFSVSAADRICYDGSEEVNEDIDFVAIKDQAWIEKFLRNNIAQVVRDKYGKSYIICEDGYMFTYERRVPFVLKGIDFDWSDFCIDEPTVDELMYEWSVPDCQLIDNLYNTHRLQSLYR